MRLIKISIIILNMFASISAVHAQETKIITGRTISEDLEILPGATVCDTDSTILAVTDVNGYFKVKVPIETNDLLFGYVAMEWMRIKIKSDCQHIEMIIMSDIIYDFISMKSINRKRQKRFKNLSKKHELAYDKGIFKQNYFCFSYALVKY